MAVYSCSRQGIFSGAEPRRSPHSLPDILGRIKEYSAAFSDKIQTVVLGLQSHSDLDCRFLGVRLSFSDFYKIRKDQTQQRS